MPSDAQAVAVTESENQDPFIYVARQPIFDKERKVFAYELLFRDGIQSVFPDIGGDLATRAVLLNTYVDIGLNRIAGKHRIFVNFTEETLLAQLPQSFPRDRLIIEILENVRPTEAVVQAIRELADHGFGFALDDFIYQPEYEPLVAQASIIKLDFLITSRDEIESMAKRFLQQGKLLLAEKIETEEEYQYALSLGFSYFQGYFFSKPEIISTKGIQSAKVNLMQILAEISGEDYDIDTVEKLLVRDVSISYKLLRYINSALLRTVNEVSSIRHAVLLLGKKEFRNFISLVLAADLASGKPLELTRTALIRARFCELVSTFAAGQDDSEYFLLGLFSLLDAILDQTMEWVTEQLPLSDSLTAALMQQGPLADFVALAAAYERGQWGELPGLLDRLQVEEADAMQSYLDAVVWTDEMLATSGI